MKSFDWKDLAYWNTGEWQVVEERLHDLERGRLHCPYCPGRSKLFAALDRTPFDGTTVAIIGQDPYPFPGHCTGVAFETPGGVSLLPASLRNIFKEYSDDLGYGPPSSGSLKSWTDQGVLLWNSFPSCTIGLPGSHHWDEWRVLTEEIIQTLDQRGNVCFVYLGGVARSFIRPQHTSPRIETSHPSPLGVNHGFLGSKLFSRANQELVKMGLSPINWRLEDGNAGRPGNQDQRQPTCGRVVSGSDD